MSTVRPGAGLLLVIGCAASGPVVEGVVATSEQVRLRGCVVVDEVAAPTAEVQLFMRDSKLEPVVLDARGCFVGVHEVGAVRNVLASVVGRGSVSQWVAPVAGELGLELVVPTAERRGVPAKISTGDRSSRLAWVSGWYMGTLRGKPSAEALTRVAARHDAEVDPVVRAAYGLVYAALARTPGAAKEAVDAGRMRAALAGLPPSHVAWGIEFEAIVLVAMAGDVDMPFVARVLAEHADPQVYGAAAYVLAEARVGDDAGVREVLGVLRRRGATSPFAKLALALDPDDQVADGRALPPFRLHRLGEAGEIAAESLRGKVYVLHFWATWCGPCVEHIPVLAALHARHAADGFEIVSVALDEAAQTVAEFRRDRHPMPWLHAWEPEAARDRLRAAYQVTAPGRTIVVDRGGVVVAEDLGPNDPAFAARIAAALERR